MSYRDFVFMNESRFNETMCGTESTKAVIGISGTESERKLIIKEDVLERAEALSLTSLLAHSKSTQPSEGAEI